ncbi:MAG: hypothetical protein HDR52_08100 [Treponema sp.]|nr:hypothetical protein [Treponema sp.]
MAQEITEELRVLVTAEVEKAVQGLKKVDTQTNQTIKLFKKLGNAMGVALTAKAAVDFVKESVKAYESQTATMKVLESTVKAVGATAWTSARELAQMAQEFQQMTNFDATSIESMQAVLLGFRNIKGDNFREATKAIMDMATVMDMDLKSAAQSIGKALDDPINGMDSLKKQGFNFTASQKKVIQSFLDTGNAAEAQKIILNELETTFGGAAEAGVKGGEQLKNAFSDMQAGIGKFMTDVWNAIPGIDKLAQGMRFLGEAFSEAKDNFSKLRNFDDWFNEQSLETQLEEATKQVELWRKTLNEAKKDAARDEAVLNLDAWRKKMAIIKETLQDQRAAAQAEAEQEEAVSQMNELMYQIEQDFEKFSKNDPSAMLERYNEELKKAASNREKILTSESIGIGSEEIDNAVRQLDYLEKEINKKILGITINGKRTWQNWLSDIFKQEIGSFQTGREAAEKFIEGIESELRGQKIAAETLGEAFDLTSAIEGQRENVRSALIELFSIDPSKIDLEFKTGDASVDRLLDWYRQAGERASESFFEGLNSSVQNSALIERAMGKAVLQTDLQIQKMDIIKQRIGEIADSMNESSLKDALADQNSELSKMINLYKKLGADARVALKDLGKSLKDISFESVIGGLESLGQALGEGKSAEDSWKQGLVDMSQAILDALPNLLLRAGLQLVADGMWPIGLGLIAASGVSAITKGAVNGLTSAAESAEANALGGVYGSADYDAFAKGGVFTNKIVKSPTYFRFARGSGFGTGLMGEAGPEAIMPLRRGADGSLGVSMYGNSGGGANAECTLTINIYSSEKQDVRTSSDYNGNISVDIVSSAVGKAIGQGKLDKTFSSRYGLRVQGV